MAQFRASPAKTLIDVKSHSPLPTIDLTDAELAALTGAIRRLIEEDKFLHAPRLEPLRSALPKLEQASTTALNLKRPPTGLLAPPRPTAKTPPMVATPHERLLGRSA